SEDRPGFVVMAATCDVKCGPPVFGHGFLPGTYQPTVLRIAGSPVLYLDAAGGREARSAERGAQTSAALLRSALHASHERGQRDVLDLVQWLNQEHRARRGADVDDLSSRIASYELAFRMQSAVPDAVDLSKEPAWIKRLYGLEDPISARFGTDCLLARRLVERGVRFVQIFTGSAGVDDWDNAHAENDKTHRGMAQRVDKPIAGLLKDLKARGLLDETLVVW